VTTRLSTHVFQPDGITDPRKCDRHTTEPATHCRCCRSMQIGRKDEENS
jgi:hypothetical protein